MTGRLLFTLTLGVGLPCLVLAQQAPVQPAGSDPRAALSQRSAPEPTLKMYEDIEIMRRLLEHNLRGIYGIPSLADAIYRFHDPHGRVNANEIFLGKTLNAPHSGVGAGDPNATMLALMALAEAQTDPHRGLLLPSAEGSYFPGHGVVYTMTLPPPSQPSPPETPKLARKPLSDWERTRLELRGEKAPLEEPAESKPPSVSGTILRLLADNGQHFAQLKDNESITVAVTFRSKWTQWDAQCAKCHVATHRGMSGAGDSGGTMAPEGGAGLTGGGGVGSLSLPGRATGGGATGGAAGGSVNLPGYPGAPGGGGRGYPGAPDPRRAGPSPGYPGGAGGGAAGIGTGAPDGGGGIGASGGGSMRGDAWGQVEDRILLGDLHAKQGRTKEAIGTYELAAAVLEKYMESSWHWDKDQIRAARELYGKMSQLYLAAGDKAGAVSVMERFAKIPEAKPPITFTAQQPPGAAGSASRQAALPAKMIVSAPKRLLDQVGGGKLSFEDFKKQVNVQYLTFGGTERKAGELMSGPDKEVPPQTPKKP